MNASLTFRREEGPLFRLKAPVRAVVFPLAVGATYSLQDGTALRVGATLPMGLSWRLQFWPWGACALSHSAGDTRGSLTELTPFLRAATRERDLEVPASRPWRRTSLGR